MQNEKPKQGLKSLWRSKTIPETDTRYTLKKYQQLQNIYKDVSKA